MFTIMSFTLCVFRTKVEDNMDPRVKPEDDGFKCLVLFVIPVDLKRESTCIILNSTYLRINPLFDSDSLFKVVP